MIRCVALSGGVGGAKLAEGLSRAMDSRELMIVANTGDDFEHLGLAISPDIDTLVYTLAGLANPETGWGMANESWTFMAALERLGGETWFRLGDKDLATHVERTRRLRGGEPLSTITADFCHRLGVAAAILPMSDTPVRTLVETPDGTLPFQHYFVHEQCRPRVTGFRFDGCEAARPHPALIEALAADCLDTVIICPSNPFISIDPILAVPGLRDALTACAAPIIAVSPIVGGRALKGPTAKMMMELGIAVDAFGVARHYQDLIDGFVLDEVDATLKPVVADLGIAVTVTQTVMNAAERRLQLARDVLGFAKQLKRAASGR